MELKYGRTVKSVAMSKWPNQSGISITKDLNDTIKIQAINPRTDNITSYLSMQIPFEDIDNVIEMLNKIKEQ